MGKFAAVLLAFATIVLVAQPPSSKGDQRVVREVRHELVMLPYYGVFDYLTYRVDGSKVTLSGQVTRPPRAIAIRKDSSIAEREISHMRLLHAV